MNDQCLTCGDSMRQPVSHVTVRLRFGPNEPPDFDEAARDTYTRNRLAALAQEREVGRAEYAQYLSSPEWRAKRQLVLKRCGGTCEGCMSAAVDQVHHLTYKHIYRELLFELVGLCDECHRVAHDEENEAQ